MDPCVSLFNCNMTFETAKRLVDYSAEAFTAVCHEGLLIEGRLLPVVAHCVCSLPFQQRRGSDVKEDGSDKPRRNVSWQDKGNADKERALQPQRALSTYQRIHTSERLKEDPSAIREDFNVSTYQQT